MTDRTLSLISTVVAIVALLISVYSNHISSRAHELSQQTFIAERKVTIRSLKQKDYLILKTLEESQQVNHITIYFPSPLKLSPMVLASYEMRLSEAAINHQIREYIDAKVKPMKDNIQYIRNYSIPTLFVILGHSKGTSTITYGIYDLFHEYTRPPTEASKLTLKSAVLNVYLDNNIAEPKQYIDKLFEQVETNKK